MLVLDGAAPEPVPRQMRPVIASIHRGIIAGFQGWFEPDLPRSVADSLIAIHSRRARHLLALACMRAANQGQRNPALAGPEAARHLMGHGRPELRRPGFLA